MARSREAAMRHRFGEIEIVVVVGLASANSPFAGGDLDALRAARDSSVTEQYLRDVLGTQRTADLAHRLQRLVFRLNRELRAESATVGVPAADALLLAEVRHRPGIGVSELAAMEKVARSVMSERVRRLETAGLLAADRSGHEDRRRIGLSITEAGRELLAVITQERRRWVAGLLSVLSADERDCVRAAVEALERATRQRGEDVRPRPEKSNRMN
jgi:DNA-binding MarR family transcriptional regulator